MTHRLSGLSDFSTEQYLPAPLETVFGFFADPRNLETLTPPWLRFRIVSRDPIRMETGTRIDYRLRLRGVSITWQSEITVWEPPHRFVDEQRRGPYRRWIHEHRFEAAGTATVVSDRVRYAVPGGHLVDRLLVAPDLRRIFAFRRAKLAGIFGT
jgi:ligand-binding SRPBCC domain-containing protein